MISLVLAVNCPCLIEEEEEEMAVDSPTHLLLLRCANHEIVTFLCLLLHAARAREQFFSSAQYSQKVLPPQGNFHQKKFVTQWREVVGEAILHRCRRPYLKRNTLYL